MKYFHYRKIPLNDKRMTDVYRLRYKVYCLECGYEDPCDYQNHIEMDEYDAHAVHFAATEVTTDRMIGTARIILSTDQNFPMLRYFDIDQKRLAPFDMEHVGEISRLAISKDYRRRAADKMIFQGKRVIDLENERERRNWRLYYENDLVAGLYHHLYAESINLGLTHLYAIMSDGLYSLLQRWGLIWHPIGEPQNHHGVRRPYIASIEENMFWFENEEMKVLRF